MPSPHDIHPPPRLLSFGGPLKPILSLGRQPLANNLASTEDLATPDPLFPLELMWSEELKLVQLSVSVPPAQLFSEYLYLTSFSPTLVEAARRHVDAQVTARQLGPGDLAMEIGSNDGYLLQHYKAQGLTVLGIDPASNVAAEARKRGIPTRCAFFGLELAQELAAEGLRPRIVHANNVMAHIPDVQGVMAGIATVLHDQGVFVVETPYVRRMIEHLEFDTIYHEHLFYYSLTSFNGLLERNGLTVVDVEEIEAHGGSLRITAARPGSMPRSAAAQDMLAAEDHVGMGTYEYYRAFGERVPVLLDELKTTLNELAESGKTLAGYGAAAKATVMVNALGEAARHVQWIADRSSYKQGRFIPGIRVPIVPVERIYADRPDYLVVFAWNYIDEITRQLAAYKAGGGRFIVPFPQPKVLD
jgi:SAM-dependent methyltransferase